MTLKDSKRRFSIYCSWVLWSIDCLQLPFIRLEEAVSWAQRFLTRKILLRNEDYLRQTNLKANVFRNSAFQVNRERMHPYLEEPNRQCCQHFIRRTTQQTFSAVNLASQQKTTKLFFCSQVRKQFKLLAVPFKSLRYCLRSDKLVNRHDLSYSHGLDLFLNFHVSCWPGLSIKSYFLMVSSLILLRSLHVYILKQLFFSISVNSGFRNIYLATSWLGKYFATIHLDFKE